MEERERKKKVYEKGYLCAVWNIEKKAFDTRKGLIGIYYKMYGCVKKVSEVKQRKIWKAYIKQDNESEKF